MMKEQLVEMTGLSPRVIRVWFQNKRCKDKKKSILLKQQGSQGTSTEDGQVSFTRALILSPLQISSPVLTKACVSVGSFIYVASFPQQSLSTFSRTFICLCLW